MRLPAREKLAAEAGRSTVVGQFRTLAEWLGPQGRALTTAKNIRPADARELVTLLGAGEEGLWQRAFEAAFAIGAAACPPIWADEPPSPVQRLYDVIVPNVLASIYSMEEPLPVPRLAASIWQTIESRFDLTPSARPCYGPSLAPCQRVPAPRRPGSRSRARPGRPARPAAGTPPAGRNPGSGHLDVVGTFLELLELGALTH